METPDYIPAQGRLHWRLVYYGREDLIEPPYDVTIRSTPDNPLAMKVCKTDGSVVRTVELTGGWLPIWYRCRAHGNPNKVNAIVFGRALPEDDGLLVEIDAAIDGKIVDCPAEWINRGAIAEQTLRR